MVFDRQGARLLRRYELGCISSHARYAQTGNDHTQRSRGSEEHSGSNRSFTQLHSRCRFSRRRSLGRHCKRSQSRHPPKRISGRHKSFRNEKRKEVTQEHSMNVQELLAEVATAPVVKRAITNHATLNEAYDYGSAFSRGMRIDLNGLTILLISGTASIDEAGRTVHVGDFRAQLKRTYENITKLLAAEGATWHDIVRTTCYLRDIERDYQAFNEERTTFFKEQGLDPLPASTGIQAILCRPDLLIEIEAIAMFRRESNGD